MDNNGYDDLGYGYEDKWLKWAGIFFACVVILFAAALLINGVMDSSL